jgi:hypothetical protein
LPVVRNVSAIVDEQRPATGRAFSLTLLTDLQDSTSGSLRRKRDRKRAQCSVVVVGVVGSSEPQPGV